MQKKEKNKFKDNLLGKQLALFGLFVLWGLLIIFKKMLSPNLRMGLFVLLVLVTVAGIYFLNRAFFGIGDDKK
ncbi:hypothetical protein ACFO26_03175 [Lactococcus nasutitermitis]|uniref:Uncharacterized protein n=1 Tax=Lactococcus nasutitermitis TaxID=1652957 RepID=A0ABV9JB36_9LACT|nr:hypothetical protein [Lactococcus nasutitermitis]